MCRGESINGCSSIVVVLFIFCRGSSRGGSIELREEYCCFSMIKVVNLE